MKNGINKLFQKRIWRNTKFRAENTRAKKDKGEIRCLGGASELLKTLV